MTTGIDFIASASQGVHVYIEGKCHIYSNYDSSRHYIEHLCLCNGTTLDGCYEASGELLNYRYKRPIYIGGRCNQIFIPVGAKKNLHSLWISLDYLMNGDLEEFNQYGYEIMSEKRWQKHMFDGNALKHTIFKKET